MKIKISKNSFDGYLQYGKKFYQLTDRDKHIERHFKNQIKFKNIIKSNKNQKFRNCEICNSKNKKQIFIKNGFKHHECKKCSFVYVDPVLKDFISNNHFLNENSYNEVLKNKINLKLDNKKFLYGLQKISNKNKFKKILDIGCGYGFFLEKAKKNGWDVYGTELNKNCLTELKKKKIKIFNFDENIKFDCITMWTVIEHISEINLFINKIKKFLKKDGKILINVPNVDSLSSRLLQKNCTMFSGEQHVNHFSPSTLKLFLEKHGFKVALIETLLTDFGTILNQMNLRKYQELNDKKVKEIFNINTINKNLLGYTILCVAKN